MSVILERSPMSDPILVPEISDCEIASMRHIEPLLCQPSTAWYQRIKGISAIDPRNTSFLWSAEPEGPRLAFGPFQRKVIHTFHHFGAPSLFKPSLAEVYASILRFCPKPQEVKFFHMESEDMGPQNIIGSCHWCKCVLFGEPST